MKIFRFLESLFIFLCITTPLELLGYPLVGIGLLFTPTESMRLPRPLKWWDNAQDYFEEFRGEESNGLCGPLSYREEKGINIDTFWQLYRARFNWLVIRNPLNYFQYAVLGCDMRNRTVIIKKEYDNHVEAVTNDGIYYEYYSIKQYSFYKTYGIRLRFGWKITSKKRDYQQFCFVINPFYKM